MHSFSLDFSLVGSKIWINDKRLFCEVTHWDPINKTKDIRVKGLEILSQWKFYPNFD